MEIQPHSGVPNNPFTHKIPYSKPVRSRFLQPLSQPRSCQPSFRKLHLDNVSRVERAFNTLEKVLETRTFLVGERLTLADLSVATVVLRAAKVYLCNSNTPSSPRLSVSSKLSSTSHKSLGSRPFSGQRKPSRLPHLLRTRRRRKKCPMPLPPRSPRKWRNRKEGT